MDNALTERQIRLMQAVADGDRRAFEQLYRLTSPHLFAVALRMLHQRGWAEEVLHDCFITVWNRAETYNSALSSPITWLTHIVRNRCMDGLRSGQARAARQDDGYSDALMPMEDDERNNWYEDTQVDRLHHCLAHLSHEQRQSITLAYYKGMSHGDIADWLQQPVGSVKSWIRRAMEHLRECLGQ